MNSRAIIKIKAQTKLGVSVNYSRRMYAIIRRHTPEAVEGARNECYAELTGLRTFFKMSYAELADQIVKDLKKEVGIICIVKISSVKEFETARKLSKKPATITTYKEINSIFAGKSYVSKNNRSPMVPKKKIRLPVPFLGKVK